MCEPKSPQLELGCGSVVEHLPCTGIEAHEAGLCKMIQGEDKKDKKPLGLRVWHQAGGG